ncbi:MAG: hypothetical protein ABMA64_00085 [Myxococcota bacterium]
MTDERVDGLVREAYEGLEPSPEALGRWLRQAERRPRRSLSVGWILLAAAAVLALAAWPLVQIEPPRRPASLVPAPPVLPPEPPPPAPAMLEAAEAERIAREAERDRLLFQLRSGDRKEQLTAKNKLQRNFSRDPAVVAVLGEGPKIAPEPVGPRAPLDPPNGPLHLRGLWVGSISGGKSFKMTVLGQSGDRFEGTVELQLADGTFTSLVVTGTTTGSDVAFSGGSYAFRANVLGHRATGEVEAPDGVTYHWTAVH